MNAIPLIVCLMLGLLEGPSPSAQSHAVRGERVLPLSLCEGDTPTDPLRALMVPVECNGKSGSFELGGYGRTRISERFATSIGADAEPDEFTRTQVDPEGKPVYLGGAIVRLKLGDFEQEVNALVVTDDHCQKPEKQGVIGADALHAFQWEVDPGAATLTLRPPGTPPRHKPLAILQAKPAAAGWYVRVRVRNASEEIAISPGSSFVQAGPKLQKAWDLNSGKPLDLEVKQFGNVRVVWFKGQDTVELTKDLKETNLPVALMGDPKHPEQKVPTDSGLGQCVLNRYVYCIDPKREQFRIMSRVAAPTSQPVRSGD
jgi:hypothetical protein